MKVIFLDVDGVLNSRRYFSQIDAACKGPHANLDPSCINRLRHIVTATGADIVLSSSWRDMFAGLGPKEPDAHSLLQELERCGLSLMDRTPLLGDRRPEEILRWLADHEQVERIVILDDHDYNWEELRPYWIPIDDGTGLTDQDVDKAIRALGY